jgi:hypothetical protein
MMLETIDAARLEQLGLFPQLKWLDENAALKLYGAVYRPGYAMAEADSEVD